MEAALDLLIEEQAAVNVISFNQSEANLRELLTHPLCSVISDGFYVNGKPHPRLHGTFPGIAGHRRARSRWIGLTEAVHKITGKPAARLRLDRTVDCLQDRVPRTLRSSIQPESRAARPTNRPDGPPRESCA